MSHLLTSITGFSFLGAFVAFLVAAVVLKFRSARLSILLGMVGLLGGWLGMMIYIFLTGGLQNTSWWADIIPIVVTLLLCYVILRLNHIKIRVLPKQIEKSKLVAVGLFTILILLLAFASLPTTGITSTASISISNNEIPHKKTINQMRFLEIDDDDLVTTVQAAAGMMSIDIEKASVRFPRIAEDPNEGQYVEFKIEFTVSNANWEQPYIKILVFKDNNENGVIDSDDQLWTSSPLKLHLTTSEGYWKTYLLYGPNGINEPLYQMNVVSFTDNSYLIMPIFSCKQGQWQQVYDDNGKTFQNTPEGYTSPEDQISMQVDANGYLTLLETDIYGFTGYAAGSSTTISGKLFCPAGTAGSHGVLVQAFDYRYQSDYFDNEATPLASKVKTFVIGTGDGNGNGNGDGNGLIIDVTFSSWTILGLFGAVTLVGTAAVIHYGPHLIKP